MKENWYTSQEITDKINKLNISTKKKSLTRINEILKKIKDTEDPTLFKTKKDLTHKGKGRKPILYNENFLFKVIEYFQKEFYFTKNVESNNEIRKLLITTQNIEKFLPPNIELKFRDNLQEKINFERNIYEDQLKLGNLIENNLKQYELKVQSLQQELLLHKYKEATFNLLLSIKNLTDTDKIKLTTKITKAKRFRDVSLVQRHIKYIRLKKDL